MPPVKLSIRHDISGVASVVIVANATSAGLGAGVANAASGTMVIKGYSSLASAAIVASTATVDSGANASSDTGQATDAKHKQLEVEVLAA